MMAVNITSSDGVGGSNGHSESTWNVVHHSSAKESVVVDGKVIAKASNIKLLHTRIVGCDSGLCTAAGGGKHICACCC